MIALVLALSLSLGSCDCSTPTHADLERAFREAVAATNCDVEGLLIAKMQTETALTQAEFTQNAFRVKMLTEEIRYLAKAQLKCELGNLLVKNRRLFEEAYGIKIEE